MSKHTFINQSLKLVVLFFCQLEGFKGRSHRIFMSVESLEGGVLSVYWGGVIIFYVDWSVWGRGHIFYVSLSGLRGGVLLILMSTEVIFFGGGVINFLCQLECFGRGGWVLIIMSAGVFWGRDKDLYIRSRVVLGSRVSLIVVSVPLFLGVESYWFFCQPEGFLGLGS